jgi:peptidoglycan/LPS O-acetylase OafA/YrhL
MNSRASSGCGRAIHFPGLNGLRSIAALTVVLYHASFSFEYAGIPQYDYLVRLNLQTGFLCVVFFFVLSGFLITYLLLAEEAETA